MFIVIATFDVNKAGVYRKQYGPFEDRHQAEACLVQVAGQAACIGGTVVEQEEGL